MEGAVGREQRLFEHDDRVTRRHRQIVDARNRRQAIGLQRLFRHDHDRRRSITDLRGGRGGERATFLQQLHARNAFQRRVKADAFIDIVLDHAFGRFHIKHHELIIEQTSLGRGDCVQVALQRELVEIVLGKAMLLHDHLSAHELAEHDAGIFLV
jgi:hypothetical protein